MGLLAPRAPEPLLTPPPDPAAENPSRRCPLKPCAAKPASRRAGSPSFAPPTVKDAPCSPLSRSLRAAGTDAQRPRDDRR